MTPTKKPTPHAPRRPSGASASTVWGHVVDAATFLAETMRLSKGDLHNELLDLWQGRAQVLENAPEFATAADNWTAIMTLTTTAIPLPTLDRILAMVLDATPPPQRDAVGARAVEEALQNKNAAWALNHITNRTEHIPRRMWLGWALEALSTNNMAVLSLCLNNLDDRVVDIQVVPLAVSQNRHAALDLIFTDVLESASETRVGESIAASLDTFKKMWGYLAPDSPKTSLLGCAVIRMANHIDGVFNDPQANKKLEFAAQSVNEDTVCSSINTMEKRDTPGQTAALELMMSHLSDESIDKLIAGHLPELTRCPSWQARLSKEELTQAVAPTTSRRATRIM